MKPSTRRNATVYPKTRSVGSFNSVTCRVLVSFLDDYVEKRLPAKIRKDFEQHIRDCKWCKDYLATYRKTIGLAGQLRTEDIPIALRRRLQRFLRSTAEKNAWFPRRRN